MEGVHYHYLNDTSDFMNSTLTREWVEGISETEIEIQVALYKWNGMIHHVPFITYLLEKQSDMYAFPRFTIPLSKKEEGEEEEEDDSMNEDILNYTCDKECKKRIFHHLRILPNERFLTSNTLDRIVFKGYITREKSNEILAVFETKTVLPDIRENCEWATLHEMINTKFIHSYTIHPLISTWFLENSALIYIKDKRGNSVEIPYVLYLLEEPKMGEGKKTKGGENKEKKTEKFNEESASIFDAFPKITLPELPDIFSSKTPSEKITTSSPSPVSISSTKSSTKSKYRSIESDYGVLPYPISHPDLGEIFLFSETGTEAARNVVFITNTVYLLDQPPDFSRYLEPSDPKKEFDSIYFQEEGEVRWGVENDSFFTNQF
jgi:hypothetical protein